MKTKLFVGLVASAIASNAAVTINFNADSVFTAAGLPVPTTAIGMLVADTTGNGFGEIDGGAITVGSFFASDDLVIYKATFGTFATDGIWSEAAADLTLSGNWGANDKLAFVWFPTLTAADVVVADGTSYGLITSPSWSTPSDGGTVESSFQIISATNNGFFTPNSVTVSLSDADARALLTVGGAAIPEPSSFAAIAGLGILGFAASRRRRVA